ncbi:hypothetical protein AGABI1DRAFT_109104 [Agaricus bisporus var. burnettii JB137-S8]|uniref:DUF6533 domain-containing protein n=1 Tax=Agaricus bisporus var. burnettii (strain JB137-S8 / ATCC MYA-4627 / FGSC 10392) TaxID=597362 RepID=K5WZH6_AGABU|nr:uncharacterized protein AGABI1DRAFT_109104 [Agaricus bisporus var. burnettii JB137-S8]EKM76022.1 hypothetical protein AGABI1DRAFT_109104 [Agaricus bisporus var. burnettii JB137-S8]
MDPIVTSAALHLYDFLDKYTFAGKYFQIAAFVMLAYDHLITLGQEVERIWERPKSAASLLFLLNRYATLIQFIIIVVAGACAYELVAFNDPSWRGEGICTVALVAVGQGQIIISIVGLKDGFAVPLPPGLVGCILTGSNTLFPSVWIAPLVTDSFIFLLTIYRTKENIRTLFTSVSNGATSVTDRAVTILLRDGLMYYFLIFLANLMNCLIYFIAEPDIKPIGASFSQLLTCTVISRLVLNLRSLSHGKSGDTSKRNATPFHHQRIPSNPTPKQLESIWTRTLNDFTEDNSLTSTLEVNYPSLDKAPLEEEVEMTNRVNENKDHSHNVV